MVFSQTLLSQKSDVSKQIKVSGDLLSAEIQEDRLMRIDLKLEINFANSSNRPVLLPKNVADIKVREILVAKSEANLNGSKLIYFNSMKESLLGKDKEFEEQMLKGTPPTERVLILDPDQDVSYRLDVLVWLDRDELFRGLEAEHHVEDISPLFLKIGLNLYFDSDVYRLLPDEKNLTFGAKVRNNWAKFGDFQFGRIYTEPIPIDLRSANISTTATDAGSRRSPIRTIRSPKQRYFFTMHLRDWWPNTRHC